VAQRLIVRRHVETRCKIAPHSAIYYNHIHVDAGGVPHESDSALFHLHQVANAPIFSFVDSNFGLGIVGGPLISTHRIAQESAAVAVRILRGETPGSIKTPPLGLETPMYDWRELQRWNIAETRLPPGSIVLFREPTLWERHRFALIAALVAMLAQTAIIAWLTIERHARRTAELEARRRSVEVLHLNRSAKAGALSASFAHERSQPLAAIMMSVDAADGLLKRDPPEVAQSIELLADIRDTNRHATGVIRHLGKLLKPGSEAELQDFDLSEVIADALQVLLPEARKRQVTIRAHNVRQPALVRADPVHVQQVVRYFASPCRCFAPCERLPGGTCMAVGCEGLNVGRLKGVPVLVVEDVWHVARALKSMLEQVGMHVIGPTATTAEARMLTGTQSPQLAIVDVNLKQETSCGLIDELHQQGVRVVVISGYKAPAVSERSVAAFLQKPFSGTDLLTTIHRVLGSPC
jgi:CheY-like chemotaxis protein